MYNDSVDKIVSTYFAAFTSEEFVYKSKVYTSKPLHVSPTLGRGFSCPPNCGGCCPKFSLDYLPFENPPGDLEERTIQFDGRAVLLKSDLQANNHGTRCKNLKSSDGRCGIHGFQPFSCDFEIIRVHRYESHFRIGTQLFGRGWSFPRTDGGKGALCEYLPFSEESQADTLRKLDRLETWTQHFGLKKTKISTVREIVKTQNFRQSVIVIQDGEMFEVA